MKTLNITFTDAEYKRLIKAKTSKASDKHYSWHEFILVKCCKGISIKL
jgi:hypothetical protein